MTKSWNPHLTIIHDSIQAIDDYLPDTREEFRSSRLIRDAVLLNLSIIGEQLIQMRKANPARFEETSHDSWIRMMGLRNVIAHAYETVDIDVIWRILTEHWSELLTSLPNTSDEPF